MRLHLVVTSRLTTTLYYTMIYYDYIHYIMDRMRMQLSQAWKVTRRSLWNKNKRGGRVGNLLLGKCSAADRQSKTACYVTYTGMYVHASKARPEKRWWISIHTPACGTKIYDLILLMTPPTGSRFPTHVKTYIHTQPPTQGASRGVL